MKMRQLKNHVISLEVRNKAQFEAISRVSKLDYPHTLYANSVFGGAGNINSTRTINTLSYFQNLISLQKIPSDIGFSNTTDFESQTDSNHTFKTSIEDENESNIKNYNANKSQVRHCNSRDPSNNSIFDQPMASSTPINN